MAGMNDAERTLEQEIEGSVHAVVEAVEHVVPHLEESVRGDFFARLHAKIHRMRGDELAEQARRELDRACDPLTVNTDNLCGFELDVLEDEAKGLQRPWGAAIGQALEVLRGRGFVGPGGVTERGRAVLRAKGRL